MCIRDSTSTSLQRQCIDIGIINDAFMEPIEQFTVQLSQTATQEVMLAVVTITDDEGE